MMLMAPFLGINVGLLLESQPIVVIHPALSPLLNNLRKTAEGSCMKRHIF